jgi:hypothetical protein
LLASSRKVEDQQQEKVNVKQRTLDEVSHNGWAQTSGESAHTFGSNDLPESSDHALVVNLQRHTRKRRRAEQKERSVTQIEEVWPFAKVPDAW